MPQCPDALYRSGHDELSLMLETEEDGGAMCCAFSGTFKTVILSVLRSRCSFIPAHYSDSLCCSVIW